jgi:hypothetical protein
MVVGEALIQRGSVVARAVSEGMAERERIPAPGVEEEVEEAMEALAALRHGVPLPMANRVSKPMADEAGMAILGLEG